MGLGMEKKEFKRFDGPAVFPKQYYKKTFNRMLVSLLHRLYKRM